MATTFTYGYTLECYVDWKDSATTVDLPVNTGSGGFDPANYDKLVTIQKEKLDTTNVAKFEVQKGFTIYYQVRVYQIKNVNGTKTYYWLSGADVGSGLTMHFGSDAKYFDGEAIGAHTYGGINSSISPANGQKDGATFRFITRAQQAGTALTNYISMSCNFNPNYFNATYGGDTSTSAITSLVALQSTPTLTIGGAKPTPPYPNSFSTYLQSQPPYKNQPGGAGGIVQTVYDPCKNLWWGLVIGSTDYTSSPGTFGWGLYTATLNGSQYGFKKQSGDDKVKANDAAALKRVQAAKDQLHTAILGDCIGIQTGRVKGSGGGSDSHADPKPPKPADTRYNPPTHLLTKNAPFSATKTFETDTPVYDTSGNQIGVNEYLKYVTDNQYKNTMMGRIIQDAQGAATLNTNPDKLTNLPGIGKGQTTAPWGFRFMYNPTSFSYSTASSNNVDWTLGSSDPGILLQGNQNVSFELYLNRIMDVNYLQGYTSGTDTTKAYGYNLGDIDAYGLFNRGTEYDIEFLYRVLNGDPLKNPLLLGDNYRGSGETADFGYTTGTPCWLYLNDNLRYFGSVANLSVSHVLFDMRMVPMLSVVNISFSRYPALWTDPLAAKNNTTTKAGSESAFIKTIGSTAGTGNP